MDCNVPVFPVHHQPWSLLKLISIELVMPSNHLVLCRPLLSCLQSCPASGSFPVSQFFASSSQSIGVSASASLLLLTGLLFSRSGVWSVSFSLETANEVHHPRALLKADESFLAFLSLILMCSRKLCFHTELISFSASPFGPLRPYLSNIRVFSRTGAEKGGR